MRPGLCLFGLGFCSCGLLRRESRRCRIGGQGRDGLLVGVVLVVVQDEGEEEHEMVALLSWLGWNLSLGRRHLGLGAFLVSRGCLLHRLLMWMKVPRQTLPPAAQCISTCWRRSTWVDALVGSTDRCFHDRRGGWDTIRFCMNWVSIFIDPNDYLGNPCCGSIIKVSKTLVGIYVLSVCDTQSSEPSPSHLEKLHEH